MISSIELNGFKSFVSDTIDFGKLTLLTGLNSSGKSSVIQAIMMLENVVKHQGEILLEGYGDLTELRNPYATDVELLGRFDDGKTIKIGGGESQFPVISEIANRIRAYKIIHISADRFGPETTIPVYTGNTKLGKRGENSLKCIDHYENEEIPEILRHEKSQGDTFLYNLEAWLGVISPNTKFKHEIQKFTDTSFATFNGHRAKNVGFGLSYSLPVIVALLIGSITPNSLVIIENPEAHLHPKGQTEIARLIALCAQAGTQVIIETHSDHLFDGIRIYAKKS